MIIAGDSLLNCCIHKTSVIIEDFNPKQVQPASIDMYLGRYIWKAKNTKNIMAIEKPFLAYTNYRNFIIDPQEDNSKEYYELIDLDSTEICEIVMHPDDFFIGHFSQKVTLDNKTAGQVATRSTAMRWGIDICQSAGWIDPGFSGYVAIEITNSRPMPIILTMGMRIGQIVLMETNMPSQYKGSYNSDELDPVALLPKYL